MTGVTPAWILHPQYMLQYRYADEKPVTKQFSDFHSAVKEWFQLKDDKLCSDLHFWRLII